MLGKFAVFLFLLMADRPDNLLGEWSRSPFDARAFLPFFLTWSQCCFSCPIAMGQTVVADISVAFSFAGF